MILGFKPQFVPKIMVGTKIHSIREDSTRRWKAGMKIHMATGVRTKYYNCFKVATCASTQKIEIKHTESSNGAPLIYIEIESQKTKGYMLYLDTYNPELKISSFGLIDRLAVNDGFPNTEAFFNFFNKDFTGKLIHWTDFKY